jgi:hypothetical protein
VEFLRCDEFRFGGPSDEDIQYHPLYGNGLRLYDGHIVENSKWLKEVETMFSIDTNSDSWKRMRHYFLMFHDEIFECIASSYYIEVYAEDYDKVLETAMNRMLGRPSS